MREPRTSRMMRTLLAGVGVLALLPVSHPFSLPARQARLPRAAQRAQRVVLQEIEPDEYIPGLDVDVRLPLCVKSSSVALTVFCRCAVSAAAGGAPWLHAPLQRGHGPLHGLARCAD